MPRKQATNLTDIADAAVSYITRHGFQRTQMAGLGAQIGVSPGTLYTYVENKDALLGLAATYLIHKGDLPDLTLPVAAAPIATIVEEFSAAAERWAQWPVLSQAITDVDASLPALQAVGEELYGLIRQYWRSILFLDRLANEMEEFAPIHVNRVRGGFVGDLVKLLKLAGSPYDQYELGIIARAANEGVSWSAMHRHMEGKARQPIGDLSEDQISILAARTFANALSAALPS